MFPILLVLPVLLAANDCDNGDSNKQVSASGAAQVAASRVPKNSRGRTVEQQNIDDRTQVTTNPAKILWIHLIALDGKIIRRMPVVSKITSSEKRLEAKHWAPNGQSSSTPPVSEGNYTDELLQPDGTYGQSDAYVYWFDPQHRYHQYGTAGGIGYLLTDYPIDLANPIDEVTGMYRIHKLAAEWQAQQETTLKGK